MKLSTQQKTAVQFAGLASLATFVISLATAQLMEIKLEFWMIIVLLLLGGGIFVFLDLRKKQ